MRPLDDARQTCETFLPGLLKELGTVPLTLLESSDSPAIDAFRRHNGPALVIPKQYGGLGADPLQALATTRALACAAPSLAVGTTMHHFSAATLFNLADSDPGGLSSLFVQTVAEEHLLIASGFSEGNPGQGIFSPTMKAKPCEGGYVLNGTKKPCSLSRSMDMLTASVAIPRNDGGRDLAVALIPRDSEGLSVHPFWSSWALAGAESDEVRVTDVFVQDELLVRTELEEERLSSLQTVGLIWFELLISASYLGIASALAERVWQAERGGATERAQLFTRLESATLLLESVARMIIAGEADDAALTKSLIARYAVQDILGDTSRKAAELLGGMAFIKSPDVAYLTAACTALSFHPPSRSAFTEPLLDYVAKRPVGLS
ncbi:acyl-CoA dehydrogenase family protein [Streptomyces sp. MNP-20]|uniref:acyl-CoA dehydrogenase family protein n=1 Tax=Streptomyces sp. MNP-20 TaxID=2721165 RepID=UPI001554E3A5|nr:acyl-CoA dehydrogenase family protein [Streptomyces sp. MNP-20]